MLQGQPQAFVNDEALEKYQDPSIWFSIISLYTPQKMLSYVVNHHWCLHKIPQLFWLDFFFFFFCLGGWSTTLMAASKTALTFCAGIAQQMEEQRGYIYILHHHKFNEYGKKIYFLCLWATFNIGSGSNLFSQLISLQWQAHFNYWCLMTNIWLQYGTFLLDFTSTQFKFNNAILIRKILKSSLCLDRLPKAIPSVTKL